MKMHKFGLSVEGMHAVLVALHAAGANLEHLFDHDTLLAMHSVFMTILDALDAEEIQRLEARFEKMAKAAPKGRGSHDIPIFTRN